VLMITRFLVSGEYLGDIEFKIQRLQCGACSPRRFSFVIDLDNEDEDKSQIE
jgi:hypothetical protein